MIPLLYDVSLGLVALSALTLTMLAVRRALLSRHERRQASRQLDIRPVAMALLDGEAPPPGLDRTDAALLSETLSRYAIHLRGESAQRITAYFEDHGDVAAEIAALDSRKPWRRATAAHRLGDMGSQTAVGPLLERLRQDGDRGVRAASVRSLGRLGAPEAAPALVAALAQRLVPAGVASQAVLALGAPALPFLRELARRASAEERSAALELIGELGDATDERLLMDSLRDTAADVRAAGARALTKLAGPRAAQALRESLSDRIAFVRTAAADALGVLGDRQAAPALIGLARTEPQFDTAAAAARAAARIDPESVVAAAGSPDAGPHLVEAADRLRAKVRLAPSASSP